MSDVKIPERSHPLRPCPFCGAGIEVYTVGSEVHCGGCGVQATSVKNWNKRDMSTLRPKAEIWATRDGDFTPTIFPATQQGLQAALDFAFPKAVQCRKCNAIRSFGTEACLCGERSWNEVRNV